MILSKNQRKAAFAGSFKKSKTNNATLKRLAKKRKNKRKNK